MAGEHTAHLMLFQFIYCNYFGVTTRIIIQKSSLLMTTKPLPGPIVILVSVNKAILHGQFSFCMSPYGILQKVQSTEKKVELGTKERESHTWFMSGIRRATLFVIEITEHLAI
jgi:hypothetical protein